MEDYTYLIRRKIFQLFGATFNIYDSENQPIGLAYQKAFKLKEDIRVYADESKTQELLVIKARQIIDFSASYDVFEPNDGMLLGTWRRNGVRSLFRDSWTLMDAEGRDIGIMKEDSVLKAIFRRFISNLWPQSYLLKDLQGNVSASFSQNFNPFVFKLKVTISPSFTLSSKLILAGGMLLSAIEGRQS